MAALSDLVSVLAGVTKLPEATVFAYGRFARETGYIAQKGRGRGAAPMTTRDAANLLIAVGGTAVTREAGAAIKTFRPLRGSFIPVESRASTIIMDWLKPLGWRTTKGRNSTTKMNADFGQFLEFLIEQGSRNELNRILRSIPALADPGSATNFFLERANVPAEVLVERGGKLKDPKDIIIGVDMGISLRFRRTTPAVAVDFGNPSAHGGLFTIWFDDGRDEYGGDLEVEARLSELSVAAMAACLNGARFPDKPRHIGHYRAFLFPALHREVTR